MKWIALLSQSSSSSALHVCSSDVDRRDLLAPKGEASGRHRRESNTLHTTGRSTVLVSRRGLSFHFHTQQVFLSTMMKLGMLALVAAASPLKTLAFLGRPALSTSRLFQRSASGSEEMTVAEKVLVSPKWPAEWPYSE